MYIDTLNTQNKQTSKQTNSSIFSLMELLLEKVHQVQVRHCALTQIHSDLDFWIVDINKNSNDKLKQQQQQPMISLHASGEIKGVALQLGLQWGE